MSTNPTTQQDQVFFTKHPILDAKRKLWGYELISGDKESGARLSSAQMKDSDELASSTFIGIQQAMDRGKRILLSFDEQSLLDKAPYAFSPEQCVVKFRGQSGDRASLVKALETLKADGYTLAVDILADAAVIKEILNQIDIITIDLGAGVDPKILREKTKSLEALLLSARVQRLDQFETLRDAGFTLFQGAFFKEPEIIADRKLTSHEISRINILKVIESDDPDLDVLAEAISTDVSVSFRLLTYLNSAAFGFQQKIQSIRQAINMLGVIKMKNWLRAVLLADMAQQGDNPQELVLLSLQRGRFLETIGREYDFWGFDPGSLFLLGLFSLIDAILGMPTAKVVEYLPLDEKMKLALCRNPNNEYQPLMELMEYIEDTDWARLEAHVQQLSFDIEVVKEAYTEAMTWAGGFFDTREKAQEKA
jgi:EAL and modified HD-GYP domain-containing signal transduction protein